MVQTSTTDSDSRILERKPMKFEKCLCVGGLVVPVQTVEEESFVRFDLSKTNRWLQKAVGIQRDEMHRLARNNILTEICEQIKALRGKRVKTTIKVDKNRHAQGLRVDVVVRGQTLFGILCLEG